MFKTFKNQHLKKSARQERKPLDFQEHIINDPLNEAGNNWKSKKISDLKSALHNITNIQIQNLRKSLYGCGEYKLAVGSM